MQINLTKLGQEAIENTASSKNMRLSENASAMVFQLFTKNIYSNPIGTVVREITSNCFDSHIEAGVDMPIIIRKHKDEQTNSNYISFIDFGVGMSPDRVENVYGVYFESTKRVDNTQIGGFGIGGKTPLAYKRQTGSGVDEYDNSFFVITVHNGIKYYYCMYEGNSAPVISLLHSEETTERNGTEVRIPVLEKDINTFKKEIIRQLYYFDSIIFEGFEKGTYDSYNNIINSEYVIIRGENFMYRGTDLYSNMHVCLGKVAYPIDYNVLGLSSSDYAIPVAIKLNIGDINVTASREAIDYSEATIALIIDKLNKAKDEIIGLMNDQYDNVVTLKDYYNAKKSFGIIFFTDTLSLNVSNVIKFDGFVFPNFKYKGLSLPSFKSMFNTFFNSKNYGALNNYYKSTYGFDGSYENIIRNNNLYYVKNDFNRITLKQSYLKSIHSVYFIIKKNQIDSNIVYELFETGNITNLRSYDDEGLVELGNSLSAELFDILRDKAIDYDELIVPEEFILKRKKRRNVITNEIRNNSITVKVIGSFYKENVRLSELFDFKFPIFWGTTEDIAELEQAHNFYTTMFANSKDYLVSGVSSFKFTINGKYMVSRDKRGGILFISTSKVNSKYFKYCKNAYHVSEFANRMAYRKRSTFEKYLSVMEGINLYDDIPNLYKDDYFSLIDLYWGNKINKLKTLKKNLNLKSIGNVERMLPIAIKYFDIDRKFESTTLDYKRFLKILKEVSEFAKRNENVVSCINLPYSLNYANSTLISILQKVMSF